MNRPHSLAAWPVSTWLLGLVLVGLLSPAVRAQGNSIEAWGWDGGNGTLLSDTPTESGFTQVVGYGQHALALRTDGSILSWGWDGHGQVSDTPGGTGFTDVAASERFSMALRADSSIVSWGSDGAGLVTNTPAGPGFTQLAAGRFHCIALRTDGSIAAWGNDDWAQISSTPGGMGFVQIAAGAIHGLALRPDGSVVSWGHDLHGQVSNTPLGTGFTQVAAGYSHSIALHADGSVHSWGLDGHGLLSDTPGGTGFTQVSAGYYHSLALRSEGSIECWGLDLVGQVSQTPEGTGFTYLAGGGGHYSLALRADNSGSAYCLGDGTGADCPCGSPGNPGEGCAHGSSAGGATLAASGNAYLAGDTFQLQVSGAPGSTPGLILRGANQLNGGLGNPAGNGLLCTGCLCARSQIQFTSPEGETTFSEYQGAPFGASSYGAGLPANYQFWYRDPANTCSGAGFNLSNAWTVTWMP